MSIKVGTKLAVITLERADILPRDVHPHPNIETAAVAMYRDPWWRELPETTQWNGFRVHHTAHSCKLTEECNETAGEIPWR